MSTTNHKNRRRFVAVAAGVLCVTVLAILWRMFPPATWGESPKTRVDGTLTIRYLDVGQGDCALFTNGDQAVLLDAGTVEQPQLVYELLCAYGIETLDAVIVSHPHADHIGGLPAVLRNLSVKTVIMQSPPSELAVTDSFYTDTLAAMTKRDIPWVKPQVEDTFSFCGAAFTVLGPLAPHAEDLNDLSLCVRVEYGKRSFLFCGDMTAAEEKTLMQRDGGLSADVLKVAHHGSGESSSRRFLEAVKPRMAVVSCGKYNDYGHPHSSTLDRLSEMGTTVYRTDVQGTVTVTTDGETIDVFTEKTQKDAADTVA